MAHATTSVACAARTMGMSGSLRRCAYCTLHQAAFAAVAHGLGPVARGELAQDRAHVELHRALTDAQRGGDGFVRLASAIHLRISVSRAVSASSCAPSRAYAI